MSSNHSDNLARDIQRLVDGQLDEATRRQLLKQLDHEPQAWRRCALAFLEDQCWREALSTTLYGPAEPLASAPSGSTAWPAGERSSPTSAAVRPAWWPAARRLVASTSHYLALAASLLLAFGLGWSAARPGAPHQRNPLPVARRAEKPDVGGSAASAAHSADATEPPGAAPTAELAGEAARSAPSMWVVDPSSDLAAQLLEAINRSRHRVEHRREWWPADFTDGQLGIVPVERVEIRLIDDTIQ